MKKGVTLVELSIVIVIIGLLIGGVMAGQELIHQAEIQKTISIMQDITRGTQTFTAKFKHIPGDFTKASKFGLDKPPGSSVPNVAVVSGTDSENDGNGDNLLASSDMIESDIYSGEIVNFYAHLSNAQLINFTYKGVHCDGSDGACLKIPGQDYPGIPIGGGVITVTQEPGKLYYIIISPDWNPYNSLPLADVVDNQTGAITTQDALQLDTKLDDGNPHTGTVRATSGYGGVFEYQSYPCITGADPNTAYDLTNTTQKACVLSINAF